MLNDGDRDDDDAHERDAANGRAHAAALKRRSRAPEEHERHDRHEQRERRRVAVDRNRAGELWGGVRRDAGELIVRDRRRRDGEPDAQRKRNQLNGDRRDRGDEGQIENARAACRDSRRRTRSSRCSGGRSA